MNKIVDLDKTVHVNERIRVPQVRLVDENGNMIGIVNTREALEIARQRGYDLVEVSSKAHPPVCRIMDYGKYKYELSKKAKKAKKKQHVIQVKEIKMRPNIEPHDYNFKLNHARRFLEHSNKVKFHLIFKGREVTHLDIGMNVLNKIAGDLADIAVVESAPRKEGMVMTMIVAPRPGLRKQKDTEVSDAKGKESSSIEEEKEESSQSL